MERFLTSLYLLLAVLFMSQGLCYYLRWEGRSVALSIKASKDYNFAIIMPELLDEWDYEKNEKNGIFPDKVTPHSNKKVWWKCSKCGKEWMTVIGNRTNRTKASGCPSCNKPHKKVRKGTNDLATKFPEIASEWHPTKNGDLTPSDIAYGTNRKVWWLGKCGHEYEMPVSDRTSSKHANCPYCSGHRLLKGFNDIATTNPELVEEWDYEKNSIKPTELTIGTHKRVWFICPFGHSYKSQPFMRVGKYHQGCPICVKESHTSFPEQALFYYILALFPDALNSEHSIIQGELDIYIPSKRTALEYDGFNFHNNSKVDIKKNNLCNEADITLIRVREKGLEDLPNCLCFYCENGKKSSCLNEAIQSVLDYLVPTNNITVDVEADASNIYNQYINSQKQNNLSFAFPEIAKEWDYDKNGKLLPDNFNYGSDKKVWWVCKEGHHYQASVSKRTIEHTGCPYCSNQKVLSGYNDLATTNPEWLNEWDWEENERLGITPFSVMAGSNKSVFWKCAKCGKSYRMRLYAHKAGSRCPYCGRTNNAKVHRKKVKNLDTGEIYDSLDEAAKAINRTPSNISACCRGKSKTAGGYHWAIIE